jgi:hypothetical protein
VLTTYERARSPERYTRAMRLVQGLSSSQPPAAAHAPLTRLGKRYRGEGVDGMDYVNGQPCLQLKWRVHDPSTRTLSAYRLTLCCSPHSLGGGRA